VTNFQHAANQKQELRKQRLLLGGPIGIGAVLAALVFGVAVVPQWLSLRGTRERIDLTRDLEGQIPLLRAQLAKTIQDQEQAERRWQRILTLIQGSGEFNTFLAQLDREARRNQVQLDLFEPVAATSPAAEADASGAGKPSAGTDRPRSGANRPNGSGSPDGADARPAPKDPLEEAGLSSRNVLLSAQGRYPNLLAFMRSVERLSLLVVPSNFSISLVEVPPPPGAPTPPADVPKPTVPQLKLRLTYFTPAAGRPPGATGARPAAPPPNAGASPST
jgi:type IV pilus assembly protein PilO